MLFGDFDDWNNNNDFDDFGGMFFGMDPVGLGMGGFPGGMWGGFPGWHRPWRGHHWWRPWWGHRRPWWGRPWVGHPW